VSRKYPYFKVDVPFQAVGRRCKDEQGRVTLTEDIRDEIVSISGPCLAFSGSRALQAALVQSETYDIYARISLTNAVDKIVLLFRTKCMAND
jgi:hypothetical protein